MATTNPPQYGTTRPGYAAEPRRTYQLSKRAFDLAVCIMALPIATVVMVTIAIAIVLDSSGSAFFIQERVGKDRRRFRMYKFRTMHSDYDNTKDRAHMTQFVGGQIGQHESPDGGTYKPDNDAHITRVGCFLRKSSLDELPQLINVLRGEMSLIGPRPNVAWEVDAYSDWHLQRLAVLPGITGWAQVHGRSSIPFETIVQYDIEYVERCSLLLDLQILWLTVRQVFLGKGAG